MECLHPIPCPVPRHNWEPQVLERLGPADGRAALPQRGALPGAAAVRLDQPRARHRRGALPALPGAGERVGAGGHRGPVQLGHPPCHPDPQQGSHRWEGSVLWRSLGMFGFQRQFEVFRIFNFSLNGSKIEIEFVAYGLLKPCNTNKWGICTTHV